MLENNRYSYGLQKFVFARLDMGVLEMLDCSQQSESRSHQKGNIMARQNIRTKGFRPMDNPEMHQAMVGLRRSSAASPHTPKPRKGTRSAHKRQAMKDFA